MGLVRTVTSIKNIGLPFLTKEVEAEKNNEVKYTMKQAIKCNSNFVQNCNTKDKQTTIQTTKLTACNLAVIDLDLGIVSIAHGMVSQTA